MKKKNLFLVSVIVLSLLSVSNTLAVQYNCTYVDNTTLSCNLPAITNCSQLSNFSMLYNSTVVDTTNFGTLVNNSVWGSLANYTEIKNRLSLCEANMSQAQVNASRLELFEFVQRDLSACLGNISQKENQINLFIGNISAMSAQCDASKAGMVQRSELDACNSRYKEDTSNVNIYYVIAAAIGAAVYHFIRVKPLKRTEEDMDKRTGDAIRQRIPR